MPYRASWRLMGPGQRVLGRGDLDGVHEDQDGAVTEILLHLQNFAVRGQDEQHGEWWGKHSREADLEMRFRVESRTVTAR
jgi:hypothetical protein